jgi:hypothetical protein
MLTYGVAIEYIYRHDLNAIFLSFFKILAMLLNIDLICSWQFFGWYLLSFSFDLYHLDYEEA